MCYTWIANYFMKKYAIIIAVLFLFLFPISPKAFAEKSKPLEYVLPYPGLLPDNPLYILKTTRDRIISFLVSEPLKKAEFNLLQSEKRLGGGMYLIKKRLKKEKLAHETISKGENYFEEAIANVLQAKKEGRDVKGIIERLTLSSQKQKAVIKELEQQVSSSYKKDFEFLYQRAVKLGEKVTSAAPSN